MLVAGGVRADARQVGTAAGAPDYNQLLDALFNPITEQLNLTQDQRAQIEGVAAAEFARSEALLLRLNQISAELDDEQSKESFDEDRVRALAAQGGQVMAEMTVVKLRVKAKVMALLTPAQRVLVAEQLRLSRERGDAATRLY